MQIVLRHLAELPVTDPAHRYLLVEVADECRHSTMFGEYIRRAGTPAYAPVRTDEPRRRSTRCPAAGRWATCSSSRSRSCSTPANRATMRTSACTRCRARSRSCTCSKKPATSASPRRTSPRCGRRCPTTSAPSAVGLAPHRGRLRRRPHGRTTPSTTTLGIADGADIARANPHHRARIVEGLAKLTAFLDASSASSTTHAAPRWIEHGLAA